MNADLRPLYGLDAARNSLKSYLRALWGKEFSLQACEKPSSQQRAFISDLGIHLPRHYHSHRGASLRALYRAAATHAAAHVRYSTHRFERGTLQPVQMAIIGVLEDARVEQLAIAELPGLRGLWLQFFDSRAVDSNSAEALLLRLSHALLDPAHRDPNPWVSEAVRLFHLAQGREDSALTLRVLGSKLGNDLGQMRAQFNPKTYDVEPVYRDDNLFLWTSTAAPQETHVENIGFVHEDNAADTRERFDYRASEEVRGRPRESTRSAEDSEAHDDASRTHYPEWDARIGHYRERWCCVIEREPPSSDPSALLSTMRAQASLVQRFAQVIQARKQGQVQRLRRQRDGQEFELDALVHAASDVRSGRPPDARLYRRSVRHKPDVSVLLLMDLSASTQVMTIPTHGETDAGSSLLSLIRQACLLLGMATEHSGDQYAVHGFRSNGRHEVEYLRFKEFSSPLDEKALAKLTGTAGAWSTRMGAAIRHASRQMRHCRTAQRLILLLTDGAPHDIDVVDPSYLVLDAARAVAQSASEGAPVFCVSVDPGSEAYLSKIFGQHHYRIIDRISQLPERLPALYLRLAQ